MILNEILFKHIYILYSVLTSSLWTISKVQTNNKRIWSKQFNYLPPFNPFMTVVGGNDVMGLGHLLSPTLNLLNPDIMLPRAACGGISLRWLRQVWIWQVKGRVVYELGYFCTCCIINGPPIKIRWSPDTLLQIRRQASKTDAIILFSI